jgi:hypothetical protein
MFAFDRERVVVNARQATTEDLLDRVTAYRAGMEPEALDIIETELRHRGISTEEIRTHEQRTRQEAIFLPDGTALSCSFCRRPAVHQAWGWHRLWRLVPLFPRRLRYCSQHLRRKPPARADAFQPQE